MYYEINVSIKTDEGFRHLFATHPRSGDSKEKVTTLVKQFIPKFPEPDYKIIITLHSEQSFIVPLKEFL